MKKVLKGELISLAHSILQLKDTEEIAVLKQKASLLYEKLSVLEYAEKHFDGPQPSIGKKEFVAFVEDKIDLGETASTGKEDEKVENIPSKEEASTKEIVIETTSEEIQPKVASTEVKNEASNEVSKLEEATEYKKDESSVEEKEEDSKQIEEDFGVHFDQLPQFEAKEAAEIEETQIKETEIEETKTEDTKEVAVNEAEVEAEEETEKDVEKDVEKDTKEDVASEGISKISYQEEKSISVETASEKRSYTEKRNVSFEAPQKTMDLFSQDKKSLNDQLRSTIKIGLNDRIAFVKHLFDNNPNEYNDALSKLNSFSNQEEAMNFIHQNLKPAHDNWQDKEDIENRFVDLVTGRFD